MAADRLEVVVECPIADPLSHLASDFIGAAEMHTEPHPAVDDVRP
jgi:hypothetical protein